MFRLILDHRQAAAATAASSFPAEWAAEKLPIGTWLDRERDLQARDRLIELGAAEAIGKQTAGKPMMGIAIKQQVARMYVRRLAW